jgi:hypothetical protein
MKNDHAVLDDRIIREIFFIKFEAVNISSLAYAGTLVISWILPFTYRKEEK